jgi:hypothetical protein
MNRILKCLSRALAAAVLGMGLLATPVFEPVVRAQEPAEEPAPGSGSGRPFDGYMGTAILAFLAFFIVGKSARR